MRISLVSERYAKALFDLAVERKVLDAIAADAKELAAVCQENRLFVLVLKSPVIGEKKKERILRDLFENRFNKMTMQFLLILVRKGREAYIPEIARNVIALYREYKQILTVYLTTAIPTTEAIRNRVSTIMKDYTNWQIELVEKIDPGIIGGFILNWGDMQYDASIRYQIERLRRGSARINLYVKGF
ncbi:MAG: ATP synthase F1 subunit delta [Bacteroidetes bacterium]|nr:MAG: ATP synthase F1 subunit delta [Bacteroidota bacterium]